MKKLLICLSALLMLCGCYEKPRDVINNSGEPLFIEEKDPMENFPDEIKEQVSMNQMSVDMLGTKLKNYKFQTYNESETTLPEGESYILEVAGHWCDHCKRLTEELKTLDVKIVQYFYQGTLEGIDEFYSEHEVPEFQILYGSNDFEKYLDKVGISSVPMLIFVGEDGTIKLVHIGFEEADEVKRLFDVAMKYDMAQYK